jgi:DNA-directed RNA polymerase beta subunit
VYGYDDVVTSHMFNILKRAFKTADPVFGEAMFITDQVTLLEFVAGRIAILNEGGTIGVTTPDEKVTKYLFKNLLGLLDKNLLPHIGLAPNSRHTKLRFLGHLIYKALLVEMQIEDSTDRDSLINKSILAAGSSYAKSFKTQFNIAVVQPIKKKLTKDFKSMPFSQVPLGQSVKSAIHGTDLERALIQAITTGNKEITMMNRQVTNRLASELLHRKNQTNVLSTGRTIRTPNTSASKQDARADEMRRVHPSYTGFICPAQSAPTGDQVGMVKQLATSATISSASSSEMLKGIVRGDPLLIPLEKCYPAAIHKYNLCKVLVNGDWIGCCQHPPIMFYKYREMRRGWMVEDDGTPVRLATAGIEPLATINWNTRSNEFGFWVSDGRMLRPLLVVRNNTELDPVGVHMFKSAGVEAMNPRGATPDACGFVQDICVDATHIAGLKSRTVTIADLHKLGVIDYVSPQEMEKCYIAKSYDDLLENRNNPLKQFTHCEIPECLVGIPALTCPFANSNPCARTTFQTNQVKQTCGWYALNWPFRIDKHAFLQYYCETPLLTTMANNYVYPNGVNAIIAIASYGGFNQEDSLCLNKSSAERGIYEGIHFNFVKTELENGEHFGNPDEAHTIDIKKHANYGLLRDGMVRKGQIIKKDDVIIGKYFTISKPTDHRTYKDMSVVYTSSEPAMVESVIRARNEEDKEFCTVKYSSVRRLMTGHKFCLTGDHEVLTLGGWKPIAEVSVDDTIATLNPSSALEWHQPIHTYHFDHAGKIYSVRSPGVSLDVTLNHKMYIADGLDGPDASGPYSLVEAKDVAGKKVQYKATAKNTQPDLESCQIGEITVRESMSSWLTFLAIWLGYGGLNNGQIYLENKLPPGALRDKLNDLFTGSLTALILQWSNNRTTVQTGITETISSWIGENCIRGGVTRIPTLIWQLSEYQTRMFLHSWTLGGNNLYTSNIGLANDLQRLYFQAGMSSLIKQCSDIWCVSPNSGPLVFDPGMPGFHEEIVDYNGKVYCVDVPNHTFYVRHSTTLKPVWTGNSSRAGLKTFWLVRGSCLSVVSHTRKGKQSSDILFLNTRQFKNMMYCLVNFQDIIYPGDWQNYQIAGNPLSSRYRLDVVIHPDTRVMTSGMVTTLEIGQSAAKLLLVIYYRKLNVHRLNGSWSCRIPNSTGLRYSQALCESMGVKQKGMTGVEYDQSDMPFTESGLIPDLILNPHSMPSRMTINQLVEGLIAKLCAMYGVLADATIFSKVNFDSVGSLLEQLGFNYNGTEKMMNGMTGEMMDTDIFISPCFYQRLQKYVEDSMYSINSGPTCVLTHQSLEGVKICPSSLVIGCWYMLVILMIRLTCAKSQKCGNVQSVAWKHAMQHKG